MIALALLFVLIIGLLSVIVRLLQRYFEAYVDLDNADNDSRLPHYLELQNEILSRCRKKEEINTVINERLMEMERKLHKIPSEENHPKEGAEILTQSLKQLLASTMTLLKVKSRDDHDL
ncbi:MAG: hypothetical protein R2814_00255 [Flavobacteriaceae bacterium]